MLIALKFVLVEKPLLMEIFGIPTLKLKIWTQTYITECSKNGDYVHLPNFLANIKLGFRINSAGIQIKTYE
jgi:hypothetical protein